MLSRMLSISTSCRVDEVSVQWLHVGERIELQRAAVTGDDSQHEIAVDRLGRHVRYVLPSNDLASPAAFPYDAALVHRDVLVPPAPADKQDRGGDAEGDGRFLPLAGDSGGNAAPGAKKPEVQEPAASKNAAVMPAEHSAKLGGF